MTTTIYLIRHGHVYNPQNIIYGRLPGFKLSEEGIKEIEQTASFLADKNIKAIYSSPVYRTRQSAKIIKEKLKLNEIKISQELFEVKTSLDGLSASEFDVVNTDYYSQPIIKKGDETIEKVAKRMQKSISKILGKHKGQSVAAFSHGDPIMILWAALEKRPLEFFSIRNHDHVKYLNTAGVLKITKSEKEELRVGIAFVPVIKH